LLITQKHTKKIKITESACLSWSTSLVRLV